MLWYSYKKKTIFHIKNISFCQTHKKLSNQNEKGSKLCKATMIAKSK